MKNHAYANPTTLSNPVARVIYALALPLSRAAVNLNITPNTITTFANIVFLLGIIVHLIYHLSLLGTLLLLIAFILDFVDGQVARMSSRVQKNSFRYDHWSDVCRFTLLFGTGAYMYASTSSHWLLPYSSSCLFLLYTALNHSFSTVERCISSSSTSPAFSRGIFSSLFESFSAINCNAFLILILSLLYATSFTLACIYILCIAAFRSLQISLIMSTIPRP